MDKEFEQQFVRELKALLHKYGLEIRSVQTYGADNEEEGIESYFIGKETEIAISDLGTVKDVLYDSPKP